MIALLVLLGLMLYLGVVAFFIALCSAAKAEDEYLMQHVSDVSLVSDTEQA